jgi:hypothetical protein
MPTISDLNAEARSLCDADTTSYPAAALLRRINEAYEQVVGWLINADGTWQFDDTNNTDLPIGTQTLVAGQSAYTFNDKFLQLLEVQIKDDEGNFRIIQPIDQREYSDESPLEEDFETNGFPQYYDKVSDDTIKLYPAPATADCTLTNGLKIKFKRTAAIFTSDEVTTGTKVPGFASPYHYILSYMAALPYCMSYKKDRVALYEKRVGELKAELIKLYSAREKDKRKGFSMASILFR